MAVKVVFLLSGTSWAIPGDYSSLVSIEGVAGGAGGRNGPAANTGSTGGGAGQYCKVTDADISLTPNQTVYFQIGGGGTTGGGSGTNTWFNKATNAAPTLASNGISCVAGAAGASDTVGGVGGGTGGVGGVGSTKNAGGSGGARTATGTSTGGGGCGGKTGGGGNASGTNNVTGGSAGAGGGWTQTHDVDGAEASANAAPGAGGNGRTNNGVGGAGNNYGAGGGGGRGNGQLGGVGAPGIIIFSYNATEPVAFTADELVGGAAVLDTPLIMQQHNVAAIALDAAAAVLGTPTVESGGGPTSTLFFHSDVVDNGLNEIVTDGATVFVCSARPTTYAEASSTYKLGSASIIFNSPVAAMAGNGRKITSNPVSGGVITGDGTVSHWAVCDASRLLATGGIDANEAVTDGWEFSLGALSLVLPFEEIVGGESFPNYYSITDNDNDSLARTGNQKAGNRKTMTFSCWIKSLAADADRVTWENTMYISGVVYDGIVLQGDLGLMANFDQTGTPKYVRADNVPVAAGWHHYVIQIDTTQATESDRVKFFVDGQEIAKQGSSTYPNQNYDTSWGSAGQSELICDMTDAGGLWPWRYDEWAFVDGQILAPSEFADGNNKPKDLSGIDFGNNGWWLRFEEFATEAEIGRDYSSNGNNFTPSGGNWLGDESTDVP